MDARTNYLQAIAIALAVEVLIRLPDAYRPDSDLIDLKEMLDSMSPHNVAFLQNEARRRVDVLQRKGPPADEDDDVKFD
jgi:hypothetical protein